MGQQEAPVRLTQGLVSCAYMRNTAKMAFLQQGVAQQLVPGTWCCTTTAFARQASAVFDMHVRVGARAGTGCGRTHQPLHWITPGYAQSMTVSY
jgi:hypothetical protein